MHRFPGAYGAMIVPGLLLQPTIVKAQEPNQMCSGNGITGCVTCPSSTGWGCFNVNPWPPGYKGGVCIPQDNHQCSGSTYWCGQWVNCTTGQKNGQNCTTLQVCT